MDGEGRSQTDYYTVRVSNPSSSGEAYHIVSAIAACTYNTDLSSYTYITQYITWVSHNFLDRSSDPPYSRRYVRPSTYSGGQLECLSVNRNQRLPGSVASAKIMQHSPNPSHTISLSLNMNDIQLHMSAIKTNSKCQFYCNH